MACSAQPTPAMDLCPCTGCPSQAKCHTGCGCWGYVDFYAKGCIKNQDRRVSKRIFTEVIDAKNNNYKPSLRDDIQDFDK